MKNLCLVILAATLNISFVFDLYGANLAIVDFSDQWTKVTGLYVLGAILTVLTLKSKSPSVPITS